MGEVPVGHRAAALPWLCPAVPSLLALADEHPDPLLLAADPAVMLLHFRLSRPAHKAEGVRFDTRTFSEPVLPEATARLLESAPATCRLDPSSELTRELLEFARRAARTARAVARETRLCPDHAAAATALLAPTGWLLAAAVDPAAATLCRADLGNGEAPADVQRWCWGLTHDAILRRVAERWQLPPWLVAVTTNLGLSPDTAHRLGAPPGLFAVVQAAVAACEDASGSLGLVGIAGRAIVPELARRAARVADRTPAPGVRGPDESAGEECAPDVRLIVKLLRAAARALRAEAAVRNDRAHADLDRAHAELRQLGDRFDTRIRDAKLTALAELAAGAGHEINNPLAVISGNAQRLLPRTDDPDARKALESIVRQSRRIADIVSDLMQFARPKPPARRVFELGAWIGSVLTDCRPLAAVKGVEFRSDVSHPGTVLHADPTQLARAVTALVRNAIDAAGPDGWVRVASGVLRAAVVVAVEDSGPGPSADAVEHMFDPFYSGRSAGRGRGLGLPTAWRVARENGGDVRYDPGSGGPTRFVLELPVATTSTVPIPDRKSA